jgi:hypothetical protein
MGMGIIKIVSFNVFYGREGVTVRLHGDKGLMYIRIDNDDLKHDKSEHDALWPFSISGAVAKLGANAEIRELRAKEGGMFDSFGLRVYSHQDVNKQTADEASIILTGTKLQRNRTELIRRNGLSHSKSAELILNVWKRVNGDSWADLQAGVVCLKAPGLGVHATFWGLHDVHANCASLTDPRSQAEIASEFSAGRWSYRTRKFVLCDFRQVTRVLFLPEGRTSTDICINVAEADFRGL